MGKILWAQDFLVFYLSKLTQEESGQSDGRRASLGYIPMTYRRTKEEGPEPTLRATEHSALVCLFASLSIGLQGRKSNV